MASSLQGNTVFLGVQPRPARICLCRSNYVGHRSGATAGGCAGRGCCDLTPQKWLLEKSQKCLGRGRKDPALCSGIPRGSPCSWLRLCASKVIPGGSSSPSTSLDPIQTHPSHIHHRLMNLPAATPQTPPVPPAPFCSCLDAVNPFGAPSYFPAQKRLQPHFTAQYSKPLLLQFFFLAFSLSLSSPSPKQRVPEVLLCTGYSTVPYPLGQGGDGVDASLIFQGVSGGEGEEGAVGPRGRGHPSRALGGV